MNAFFQYQFVDNGSGLSFPWVTKGPMAAGSMQDLMRDLLKQLLEDEKIKGSREVIDMAKAVSKLPGAKLSQLFGRGSDCAVVGMAHFDTLDSISKVQIAHRSMFAHSVRSYLLGIPYDSDIFDPDVNAVIATNSEKVGASNKILVECYRRVKDPELVAGEAYDEVRSGFIQCRYTGQCWSFRTKKISTFNVVFTRRTQGSRGQFLLWVEQDRLIGNNTLRFEEGTITRLKNASLYESLDRKVMEQYYKIPAGV